MRSFQVLSTNFGMGQDFLQTWATWRADPQRPQQLHFCAVLPQAVSTASLLSQAPEGCQQLAEQLAAQIWGLLPGVHRLAFEEEQVLLTLWVGDANTQLRQQHSSAHVVLAHPPLACDSHGVKTLAKHCRRGTHMLLAQDAAHLPPLLQSAGFEWSPEHPLQAIYNPRWEPKQRYTQQVWNQPQHAVVIGAGLAGAAIARSLATRGWQVTVIAQGNAPADGASGLPAGLFCPHVSPDDSVLSRLSRSGVRMTLQRLQQLCEPGADWAHSGVLEHAPEGSGALPRQYEQSQASAWSHTAQPHHLEPAHLPPNTDAIWHPNAGWVKPAQLVRAQLNHPRIQFVPNTSIQGLRQDGNSWQCLDPNGHAVMQAPLVVLATGPATGGLLPLGHTLPLQPVRGQVTWGLHTDGAAHTIPPYPANGSGNLVPYIPTQAGKAWFMGSTFERDVTELPAPNSDQATAHGSNLAKLRQLLPQTAMELQPWFTLGDARCQNTWAQVRCTSHDRLPIAGTLSPEMPGLAVMTAMGSRGLTLSILCAEMLAASLHAEPLPLDAKLARHLSTERIQRSG